MHIVAIRPLLAAAVLSLVLVPPPSSAQTPAPTSGSPTPAAGTQRLPPGTDLRNIAPGFEGLRPADKVVLMPVDVELFSMSAGGVLEPKADWTAAAQRFMAEAIASKKTEWQLASQTLTEQQADDFAEQTGLHAAVAGSIALHHSMGGPWALPTKAGKLDWSFGDAMKPLAEKTGARYGLFVWVRDSYASAERKATMVVMALLGVGIVGGAQIGYASLVDLDSGRVVWFNRLARGTADLREAAPARDTMDALLSGFPAAK